MKEIKRRIFGETFSTDKSGTHNFEITNIDQRPGGWVVVSFKDTNGKQHRKRLSYWVRGKKFTYHVAGIGDSHLMGHGEIVSDERESLQSGSTESTLVSQFPSKVRKVFAKSGTAVTKGTPLVVLEAMKMEFVIEAPTDGVVTGVKVSEGQTIDPGIQLIDWESKGVKK